MPPSTPWHEDDDFWRTFAPVLFPEPRWAHAPVEVDHILQRLGVAPGAAILDLCCGPGRHSLELARRGFRVTGVDRTAAYLETARAKAAAEGLSATFVPGDMREYRNPDAYDAVINMFTSFGFFDDSADDRRVIRCVFDSLKPGGAFLIDMLGKEILARNFRERDWSQEEDGSFMLEEGKIEEDWARIRSRWILLKGADRRECSITLRLYSAAELAALLRDTGFGSVAVFGDLAGAPYDQNAKRLIAVARK